MGGSWRKAVERGAAAISDDMAIRALEQNEMRVHRDYGTWMPNVSADVKTFLERSVWPEEEATYRRMSELTNRIQAAR
jgi:hypothetical protein